MKLAAAVLVMLSAFPGVALAHPPAHPPPPSCGPVPHHPHKGKHPPPQCVAGNVTTISPTGMEIQPVHGHPQRIAFVDTTVFQTDSGPGTLEGIVTGDFACVTGKRHGHALTAQLVVFDLKPFKCRAGKPHPPPVQRGV